MADEPEPLKVLAYEPDRSKQSGLASLSLFVLRMFTLVLELIAWVAWGYLLFEFIGARDGLRLLTLVGIGVAAPLAALGLQKLADRIR